MNILITNDDGIEAKGIRELTRAMAEIGNVYVFAPDGQRSATGHSITIIKPVSVERVWVSEAGDGMAYKTSGTPADCVKMGLEILREQGISVDLVVSGINHGSNLGTDVHYSGTVSAAIEGALNKIPSIAVSVEEQKPEHFEVAAEMAAKIASHAHRRLSPQTVLNMNVPDLPKEAIRGIRLTRLGPREYNEWFESQIVDGEEQFRYSGAPVIYEGLPEEMDVMAAQNGYITITPLQLDLTDHELRKEMGSWGLETLLMK